MSALLLTNPVQRYAWGSVTAIPQFLGVSPDGEPWAELWMGAHPRAPSQVSIAGVSRSLSEVIEEDPNTYLGPTFAQTRRLPYLFKYLAAAQPLSIQCHPDDQQARTGYDREEAAGVPRGAAHRVYPDPTAKPELVVAQSTFVGLKGFRTVEDLHVQLSAFGLDALRPAPDLPAAEAVRAAFCRLMQATASDQRAWLEVAVARARERQGREAQWITALSERYPGDAGALAPALLNIFCLQPGEALFLRARELHAYLEGSALELMANSDNVLRGGLTKKHVDVPELLRVLDFTPRRPEPVTAKTDDEGWLEFETPTPQFSLRRAEVDDRPRHRRRRDSLEIALCTAGQVQVEVEGQEAVEIRRGQSVAIAANAGPYIVRGSGQVYLATVGHVSPLK